MSDATTILRGIDGRIVDAVWAPRAVPSVRYGEMYPKPMARPPGKEDSPWYGIDLSRAHERRFHEGRRFHNAAGQLVAREMVEREDVASWPPEILSRRTQEVEAEWLRLGALLDRLRAQEQKPR